MDIVKIIREEINNLDWVKDIEPSIGDIIKYTLESLGKYKVDNYTDNNGDDVVEIFDKDGGLYFEVVVTPETTWYDVLNQAKSEFDNCIKQDNSKEVTEEYLQLFLDLRKYNNIKESIKHLDRFLTKLSLLNEVKDKLSPEFEWDFSEENKEELDLSKEWVKTKKDVLKYINLLLNKIKSLPSSFKKKILKYVLASFLGILTINQVNSIFSTVENNDYKEFKSEILSYKKETPNIKKTEIRKPSQYLYKHLKKEEGIGGNPVLYFYDIGDGAYTTGYGHAVFSNPNRGSTGGDYSFVPKHNEIIPYDKKNPNKKITKISAEQAEQLLYDDMLKASEGVNKILNDWESEGIKPKITQGMYDAMVSIAYNHGISNLRTSNFIQLTKKGQFEEAKEEIKNISSNLFNRYPGLKIRREKESKMFMS